VIYFSYSKKRSEFGSAPRTAATSDTAAPVA
jgi:hypothetical protein